MSASTTQWFLLSSDGEISVRISDGMRLGESDLGELELVPLPEDVRVTLHSYADGVQVVAAAGFALAAAGEGGSADVTSDEDAPGSALLGHGDRIDFAGSTAVVSSDFSSSYRTLGTVMREGTRYAVVPATGPVAATPIEQPEDEQPSDEATDASPISPSAAEPQSEPEQVDAGETETATVIERAFGAGSAGTKSGPGAAESESTDAPPALPSDRAANDSEIVAVVTAEASGLKAGGTSSSRFGLMLAGALLLIVGMLVVVSGLVGSDSGTGDAELASAADEPAARTTEVPPAEPVIRGRGAAITESITPADGTETDLTSHRVVDVLQPGTAGSDDAGSADARTPPARDTKPAPAEPVAETVVDPELSVQEERIARLLAEADAFYEETIWTRGVEGSTAERLIEVLKIDPSNQDARAGLQRLESGIANMQDAGSRRSSQRRLDAMIEAAGIRLTPDEASVPVPAEVESSVPNNSGDFESGNADVDRLFALAQQRFEAGFLTEPVADNALAYAREVLALEPAHAGAADLLDRIADRLFVVASELAAYEHRQQATELVAAILTFSPNHARARGLAAELGSDRG